MEEREREREREREWERERAGLAIRFIIEANCLFFFLFF